MISGKGITILIKNFMEGGNINKLKNLNIRLRNRNFLKIFTY